MELNVKEILVMDTGLARVRLISIDYRGRLAQVEGNPCECARCTVGYTDDHHRPHEVRTVGLDQLCFPEYTYLHYWEDGPVKERFVQKSGTRLTEWELWDPELEGLGTGECTLRSRAQSD
jgi:hypothetical protein